MDWTLEDNMVDSLFFCATFTCRKGGHTSFVQAGAETPDTGAEAVKPDPGQWMPVSEMKMRSPTTPHSIGDPPTAPHVCFYCQMK